MKLKITSILFVCYCFSFNANSQPASKVETISQLTNMSGSAVIPVSSLIKDIPIGCGYSSSELQPILTNVNAFSTKDTTFSSPGNNIAVRGYIIDNYSNYYQAQDVNLAAAAKYLTVNGSLGLNMSMQNDFSSKKFYLSIEFLRITKLTTLLGDSKLTKAAKKLLNNKNTLIDFIQNYGDQYVYAIVRGNSFKITFEFDNSQGSDINSIKASASAAFNSLTTSGSITGDFSNTVKSEFQNNTLKYTIENRGFKYDSNFVKLIFSDFANVQVNISKYLQNQVGIDESVPLYVFTRNYDKKTSLPQYDLDVLSDIINGYQTTLEEIKELGDAINSPDLTPSLKLSFNLIQQKSGRQQLLINITDELNHYLASPNTSSALKLETFDSQISLNTVNLKIPPIPIINGSFSGNVQMNGDSPPVVLKNLPPGQKILLSFHYFEAPGTSVWNGRNFECHTRLLVNGSTIYDSGDLNENNSNNSMSISGNSQIFTVPSDGMLTCIIHNDRTLINGNGSSINLSGTINVVYQ
jgi:hypothetical protein